MSVESGLPSPVPPDAKLTSAGPAASGTPEVPLYVVPDIAPSSHTIVKLAAVRAALQAEPKRRKNEGPLNLDIPQIVEAASQVDVVDLSEPEQQRLIRQTLKEAKKKGLGEASIAELYENTGLTPEMVDEAKRAGRREYLKSARYLALSEGVSTAAGWGASQLHLDQVFDLDNMTALGLLAAAGRLSTIGLIAWKGHLNNRRIKEVDGVATDPLAKMAHENGTGKNASWKGYLTTNGSIEAYYGVQTVGLGVVQGLPTALVFDAAASWVASGKLLGENLYLTNKLRKAGSKKNEKNLIPQIASPDKIVFQHSA